MTMYEEHLKGLQARLHWQLHIQALAYTIETTAVDIMLHTTCRVSKIVSSI